MTRKDYIKIAKILNDTMAPARVVDAFTTMLQTDNERFKASTFKNAVYVGAGKSIMAREW